MKYNFKYDKIKVNTITQSIVNMSDIYNIADCLIHEVEEQREKIVAEWEEKTIRELYEKSGIELSDILYHVKVNRDAVSGCPPMEIRTYSLEDKISKQIVNCAWLCIEEDTKTCRNILLGTKIERDLRTIK